jgi:hypothetical protein
MIIINKLYCNKFIIINKKISKYFLFFLKFFKKIIPLKKHKKYNTIATITIINDVNKHCGSHLTKYHITPNSKQIIDTIDKKSI